MKKYKLFIGFITVLLLNACTNNFPTRVSRYTEDGYIFYGCCHYGYFKNSNYDMGGANKRGCYTPDCSSSVWR